MVILENGCCKPAYIKVEVAKMANVVEPFHCRVNALDVSVGVSRRIELEFFNQILRHLLTTKENVTKQSPDQLSKAPHHEGSTIFAKEGLAVDIREGNLADVSVDTEEGIQRGSGLAGVSFDDGFEDLLEAFYG